MFTAVRVRGYRSIDDSGTLPLGSITVLIGPNNSGKSALLRAVNLLQYRQYVAEDVRIGVRDTSVELSFNEAPAKLAAHLGPRNSGAFVGSGTITWHGTSGGGIGSLTADFQGKGINVELTTKEPYNLIVPVLAGRRVNFYREQTGKDSSVTVMPQDSNLVSRVMPLIGSTTPEGMKFARLCQEVLGVSLKVLPGDNNQQFIGVQVDLHTSIPLEAMGAGLSGALSLIVGLCQAKGKLFLIEEPEDDLHPAALKRLLDAIAEASEDNQFLISTHSSTVLSRLGALPGTVVVQATSDEGLPPTSRYEVKESADERIEILRDLGYSLADLSLGEGWLIFEEASAERLVYEWLAPWFAPALLRLRHLSARGNERVHALLTDFKELFLFAHQEPMYKHRAWVILDGDIRSLEILERLRSDFADWPESRFQHWEKEAIEYYYPPQFASKYVNEIQPIKNRKKRQEAKQALFLDVVAWIEEDPDPARKELEESAAEMITVLRKIETDLASL